MKMRIDKVYQRLSFKIWNLNVKKDIFDQIPSKELEWYVKGQNIESQVKLLTAFSMTTLTSFSLLLYFTMVTRGLGTNSIMSRSLFLRPVNIILLVGGVLGVNLNSVFQKYKLNWLYNVYKHIDDKEEADIELEKQLMIKHEKQMSKAALSKYKYDPQSYH